MIGVIVTEAVEGNDNDNDTTKEAVTQVDKVVVVVDDELDDAFNNILRYKYNEQRNKINNNVLSKCNNNTIVFEEENEGAVAAVRDAVNGDNNENIVIVVDDMVEEYNDLLQNKSNN